MVFATATVVSAVALHINAQPIDGSGNGTGGSETSEINAEDVLEQATAHLRSGDHATAHALIDDYFATNPAADMLPVNYARAILSGGDVDGTVAYLTSHLERFPTSYASSLELGNLYMNLLRFEESVDLLNAIPESHPLLRELAQLNLGKVYRALGEFELARALYGGILDGSRSVFAESALCEIELSTGDLAGCQTRLENAREQLGDHPALTQSEAIFLYLSSEFETARSTANSIFALGQPGTRVYGTIILAHLALGQPEQAEAMLSQARVMTVRGERTALRAFIALVSGDTDAAATLYQQATEENALFSEPDRAAQVLHWHPDLVASVHELLEPADTEQPATGSGNDGSSSSGNSEPEAGCCQLVAGQRPQSRLGCWLGLTVGCLATRRLMRRRSCKDISP